MMQPASGVVPSQMAPISMDSQQQQQYQHTPPPPNPQQWMMMQQQHQAMQQQPIQNQPPPVWAQQPPQAPVPHQQTQQYSASPGSGSDEIRSLWIGDLQYWMDDAYINSCFYPTGELVSVKIIRNKQTGQPEGYGFLEFRSRAAAEQILVTYNGSPMPNADQSYRLNWATLGAGERRADDSPDHTIFVGDLAAEVTDYLLQETFKAHYPSVKGAKVVTDRTTGRSKGYGFVRFGEENEQMRAMSEMNGAICSSRPMRIGPAATKKPIGGSQQYQKGHREALIFGGLQLISSAEMISL